MLRVKGVTQETDDHVDLSFRRPEAWMKIPPEAGSGAMMFVMVGDEECGPKMAVVAQPAGISDKAKGHAHATDNFRISLLGTLTMGRERYGPGEFRFQNGWRGYPDEGGDGPDGRWSLVMMADRRGSKPRYLDKEYDSGPQAAIIRASAAGMLASFGVLRTDATSDDPRDGAGPSALATTLGVPTNSGKLNGSFADHDAWLAVSPSTRAAVALLGEMTCGPIAILTTTEALQVAIPRSRFDTEVFHLVVNGSCDIGSQTYNCGDMRIQRAGTWSEPVVAGPDGLHEFLVIADRRHPEPDIHQGTWPYGSVVTNLLAELSIRNLLHSTP